MHTDYFRYPSPWRTNLVTFIVMNLLSKDAIVSFVTLFYINVYFKWYIVQG